jgi:hypothetical protein
VPLSSPHQRNVALQKQISQVTALYGLIVAIMPDDLHQGISKIPAFGDECKARQWIQRNTRWKAAFYPTVIQDQ